MSAPGTPSIGQLIIELVDVSEISDSECLQHCFSDLAETNKAANSQVFAQLPFTVNSKITQDFQTDIFAGKLTGMQTVVPNKRPGEEPRDIYLQMVIVRLKKYTCDVLITLNTEFVSLKPENVDMESQAPALLGGLDPSKRQQVEAVFDRIVGSFRHTSEAQLRLLFDC